MKIDQQALEDHQVRLTVEIENDTYEGARRRAARQIAKRVKVPGFRPGKAPFNVIEKQVGPEAIKEEAIDIILDDVYPQVLEESGVQPWGPGTLEKVDEEKEARVFEFRVPLSPQVQLGDYAKIRLPFKAKKVAKKDVDAVIENLRDQQAVLQPVERPVEEGDMAYVLLSAERDEPDEDGNTDLLKERQYPVVIEAEKVKSDTEWPFPGFSRQLIGLEAGSEKDFKHTFDKESEFEDLRGASATFHVKLEEIKDRILPEVDDEFAKSLGEYENVKALRDEVKSSLEQNFAREAEDEYENQIVEKIIEGAEIQFPPQLLDHEIDHYIEELNPQLASQGLTMENYLASREMDMDALRAEVQPTVEERVKKSLVLSEVSRQEDIEVSEEDIQELMQERIASLQSYMSEEEARKALSGDSLQALVTRTMNEEIIKRTLARLRAIAKGEGEQAEAAKEKEVEEKPAKSKKAKSAASSEKQSTSEAKKKDKGAKDEE